MPRTKKPTEDLPQRKSARLVAKTDVVKEETPKAEPKPKNPKTKKTKLPESASPEVPTKVAKSNGNDFEIVDKKDVPAHDSKEVKEAIEAQGPDGNLLVDVVQVTKEDVKDAPIDEVEVETNGTSDSKKQTQEKTEGEEKLHVNGKDKSENKSTDSEKKVEEKSANPSEKTENQTSIKVQQNGNSS